MSESNEYISKKEMEEMTKEELMSKLAYSNLCFSIWKNECDGLRKEKTALKDKLQKEKKEFELKLSQETATRRKYRQKLQEEEKAHGRTKEKYEQLKLEFETYEQTLAQEKQDAKMKAFFSQSVVNDIAIRTALSHHTVSSFINGTKIKKEKTMTMLRQCYSDWEKGLVTIRTDYSAGMIAQIKAAKEEWRKKGVPIDDKAFEALLESINLGLTQKIKAVELREKLGIK